MELSVEKEMCQMSEQEDSLEKTLKIKKEFFAAFAIWVTQIFFDFKKMCLGNTFLMACKYVYVEKNSIEYLCRGLVADESGRSYIYFFHTKTR